MVTVVQMFRTMVLAGETSLMALILPQTLFFGNTGLDRHATLCHQFE
jgi:hypothetical protein